jgi:hypothetical protein
VVATILVSRQSSIDGETRWARERLQESMNAE